MSARTPPAALLLGVLVLAAPAGSAAGQAVYSDDRQPNVFPPLYEFGAFGDEPGRFNSPVAVAVGPGDRVYVADARNHRIQVLSISGRPLGAWGRKGSAAGEFRFPSGVAVGPGGEVFVADTGNDRLQVFDAQGKYLRGWGARGAGPGSFLAPAGVAVSGELVAVAEREAHRVQFFDRAGALRRSVGGFGDAPGRFKEPAAVAIDDEGSVYVADTGNHRVQKLDAQGAPQEPWGRWGPHPGFFSAPAGLAVHGGRITVADTGNHRIQVFDRSGAFLSQWGRHPPKPHDGKGRLHGPSGVAVNPTGGFTVVCEPLEHRLQVFANGSARALKRVADFAWWDDLHNRAHGIVPSTLPPYTGPSLWETQPPILVPILEQDAHALLCFDVARRPPYYLARTSGYGRKLGEMNGPGRIAFDAASRRMWVSDRWNRRIQLVELPRDDRSRTGFTSSPRTISAFSPAALVPASVPGFNAEISSLDAIALHPGGALYLVDAANGLLLAFDAQGRFLKALAPGSARPADLAFSPDGRTIYVLDRLHGRVALCDEEGRERGNWDADFRDPAGIATDAQGLVYVSDRATHRITQFDAQGKRLLQWGELGNGSGQFSAPESILYVPAGYLVVDDAGNHRGQTFTRDGKPVELMLKGGSLGPVQR